MAYLEFEPVTTREGLLLAAHHKFSMRLEDIEDDSFFRFGFCEYLKTVFHESSWQDILDGLAWFIEHRRVGFYELGIVEDFFPFSETEPFLLKFFERISACDFAEMAEARKTRLKYILSLVPQFIDTGLPEKEEFQGWFEAEFPRENRIELVSELRSVAGWYSYPLFEIEPELFGKYSRKRIAKTLEALHDRIWETTTANGASWSTVFGEELPITQMRKIKSGLGLVIGQMYYLSPQKLDDDSNFTDGFCTCVRRSFPTESWLEIKQGLEWFMLNQNVDLRYYGSHYAQNVEASVIREYLRSFYERFKNCIPVKMEADRQRLLEPVVKVLPELVDGALDRPYFVAWLEGRLPKEILGPTLLELKCVFDHPGEFDWEELAREIPREVLLNQPTGSVQDTLKRFFQRVIQEMGLQGQSWDGILTS